MQRCVDLYYHDPKNNFPYLYDLFEPRGLVMKDFVWYLLGHTRYRVEKIWPLSCISDIKIKDLQYRPDLGFTPERFWKANKKQWVDAIL